MPAGSAAKARLFGREDGERARPLERVDEAGRLDRGNERGVVGGIDRVLDDVPGVVHRRAPDHRVRGQHGAGRMLASSSAATVIGSFMAVSSRPRPVRLSRVRTALAKSFANRARLCYLVRRGSEGGDLDDAEVGQLLSGCALGDRAAFGRLYEMAAPKLFGVALRILGHRGDAEDAAQEAFVKVWHNADRYQPGRGSAAGWIVAIARNMAIDRLRARKAPTRDLDDMVDWPIRDRPGGGAATADERRRIDACLGQLPPDRARAVQAAYVEGYSYDELARALDVPLNTVRTWLRRALIALRKCLEP